MKKLIIPIITIFLMSCSASVSNYYQVFKTVPENGTLSKDKIVFEDSNCIVSYNLWADGGEIGFSIYNKTDSDLTLDLSKTFYILNGIAYEYYQKRTFSMSSSSGTTLTSYPYYNNWNWYQTKVSGTNTSSFETSFEEKTERIIPPNSLINVSEFHVSNSLYENCDLSKYPSSNKIKTVKFEKSNSPFVFYNLISYKIKSENKRMENKFYVSEVTNVPSTAIVNYTYKNECGVESIYGKAVFNNVTPDKFYIQYKYNY